MCMNKRIEELAGQANFGTIVNGEVAFDPRLDRFAKLLVADCVKLCEDQATFLLRFSQFGSNAAMDCADILKQHFGEEE